MRNFQFGVLTKFVNVTERIPPTEQFTVSSDTFGCDARRDKTKFLCIEHKDLGMTTFIAEGARTDFKSLAVSHGDMTRQDKPLVTFIVPSVNRPTLKKALQSLKNTQSASWKAILVLDGVDSRLTQDDLCDKIKVVNIPKTGFSNCAGAVRNKGIAMVDTEWTAFLDDDDEITSDYIYRLQQEAKAHPHAEVILFRMIAGNELLPPKPQISLHDVGISFAMKTHLAQNQGFVFKASPQEDFDLLHALLSKGKNVHVSDFCTYLVRPPPP